MAIIALVLVVAICLYGEAVLLNSLRLAEFSVTLALLHLGLATAAVGLVWSAGVQIDRQFARATEAFLADPDGAPGDVTTGMRGLGALVLMLLPLLLYLASLALVLTLALGFGAAALVTQASRLPLIVLLAVLLMIGGAIVATLMLFYHLLFPGTARVVGGPLARDRHPRLWALNHEVATAVGTRPVDQITIVPAPGIGVYEAGGFLAGVMGRGQRVLEIGLPALHDLSVREFAAILAHEYGHFRRGDTRWATFTAYLARAMRATMAAMPGPGTADGVMGWLLALSPGYWVLRLYTELFFRVTGSFSRWREVMADREAIRLAGGPAFRSALFKVGMNGQLYGEALERHYLPAVVRGGPLVSDPVQLLATAHEQTPKAILKQFETVLLDPATTTPYDTHPPTRLRLDYAERASDQPGGSSEPVVVLFEAWDEIANHVMTQLHLAIAARYR